MRQSPQQWLPKQQLPQQRSSQQQLPKQQLSINPPRISTWGDHLNSDCLNSDHLNSDCLNSNCLNSNRLNSNHLNSDCLNSDCLNSSCWGHQHIRISIRISTWGDHLNSNCLNSDCLNSNCLNSDHPSTPPGSAHEVIISTAIISTVIISTVIVDQPTRDQHMGRSSQQQSPQQWLSQQQSLIDPPTPQQQSPKQQLPQQRLSQQWLSQQWSSQQQSPQQRSPQQRLSIDPPLQISTFESLYIDDAPVHVIRQTFKKSYQSMYIPLLLFSPKAAVLVTIKLFFSLLSYCILLTYVQWQLPRACSNNYEKLYEISRCDYTLRGCSAKTQQEAVITWKKLHPGTRAVWRSLETIKLFVTFRVCGRCNVFVMSVCVCVCLSVRAISFEWVDIETLLGQGQGHLMGNANFATLTSV